MRSKMNLLIAFVLVLLLSIAFLPAQAATLTVTDCSSSSGMAGRLAETITAATDGDTIEFGCGTATILFSAQITLSKNLIIDGNNTITFDTSATTRFFVVNSGFTVTLQNFTFQDGLVTGSGTGGAVLNNGTLTVNNSTFTNNAAGAGGAIANNTTGATLTVNNSTFTNNTATSGGGAISNLGTAFINNSTFTSNHASSGGAVSSILATVTITNSTFESHTGSATQGTVWMIDGTANITGVTFINNNPHGAIFNQGLGMGPVTTVSNTSFTNSSCRNASIDGGGNTRNATSLNCPGTVATNVALSASATCLGNNLQVTISAGDGPFNITGAGSGLNANGVSTGTTTLTGPGSWSGVTVTETTGDTQNIPLGDFNCFTSSTLTATATCNGADVEIVISNGNAPFTVNVTTTSGVLSLGGVVLGTYGFTGPDTFSNINVVEESGDLETLNLPSVTCTATTPPIEPVAPAPVVLSPDLNALGCELTSTVEMPNASDNTYCRVLMRDGAVIGYSGAIPAQLVNLGVIFAVDVYQLRGGQAVNEFVGYQQICLAGEGRLFYMDSRNAPRVSIELATETVNGLTCGWIPAPGTLILTN